MGSGFYEEGLVDEGVLGNETDVFGDLDGPIEGFRPFVPLTDSQIKSTVSREILDSHGTISSGSQISEERRKALRMFFGKPLGNEVEGRSQVVLTEIADTIHWLMPSLMRMFAGGEDIFSYRAMSPEDEDGAAMATLVINKVFWDELDGFQLLYDWMFTALLEKNGFLIVYYDERAEPKRETYRGLSQDQLAMLQDDGRGLEIVEFEQRSITVSGEEMPVFDVTVMQTATVGRIRVDGVPPEELMVARRTIRLDDDTSFVGQRKKLTASDLIAMGFDPSAVASWPTDESPEFSQGRTVRLSEEETFPLTTADRADAASREMWVNNCWIRLDADGDGYSELRHIMVIGDTASELILNEYANFQPFASLTASPVPHKFFGQSIADLIGDLQVIRTTLFRQMLDNLYLINNSRTMVVRGQVELNDLLTSRPGGIVRVDSLESMLPIVQAPLPSAAMEMMNKLDEIREIRVGVSRYSQGLDASSLSGSATQVNAMVSAGQARVELIGRIFAQTGFKQLGKLLLRTFIQNDTKKRTIRLNGKWVDVDPSQWNENMDVSIKTGLGVGAQSEMIGFLMATIQLQKEALQTGAHFMVTPKDLYKSVTQLTKAMGFRGSEVFFTDPGDQDWPKPPPDPKTLENQRKTQDDQQTHAEREFELQTIRRDKQALELHRTKELEQKKELTIMEQQTRKTIAALQSKGIKDGGPDSEE